MSVLINNPSMSELIHPLTKKQWHQAYHREMSLDERKAIESRFMASGISPEAVIGTLDITTMQKGAMRMTHEVSNIGFLGKKVEDVQNFELVHDRRKDTAHFLRQMGIWAQLAPKEAYNHPDKDPSHDGYKYGLELYGAFQRGDWNGTKAIDGAIRRLIPQVEQNFSDAKMLVYQKGEGTHTYSYVPLLDVSGDQHPNAHFWAVTGEKPPQLTMAYTFGCVRRRRPIADIAFQGLDVDVTVFKESSALVVVGLLDDAEKNELQERVRYHKEQMMIDPKSYKPSRANLINRDNCKKLAGYHFELGIHEPEGQTRIIVPISSHYVGRVVVPYAFK